MVCKGQSEVVLLLNQKISSKDYFIFYHKQKFIIYFIIININICRNKLPITTQKVREA